MAPTRKVTNIPGVYAFEGKSYGPFSATNKKEFVEVPADLAASLNLPLHESELDPAQDEIQAEGADIQELRSELESTQSDFIRYQNDLPGLRARVAELEAGAAAELESVLDVSAPDNRSVAKPDAISLSAEPATAESEAQADPSAKPAHAPRKASKP